MAATRPSKGERRSRPSPAGRAGGEQRTHGESAAPEDLVCARPSGRGRGGGELSVQFDVLIAFEPHKKHVEPLRKELIEIKCVSMQTNKYSKGDETRSAKLQNPNRID